MAMEMSSATIHTGDDRMFSVYLFHSDVFASTKSMAPALALSSSGFRGTLSRLGIERRRNDQLKTLVGLNGKCRFLDASGIEIVLRNRLDDASPELKRALHDLDDARRAALRMATSEASAIDANSISEPGSGIDRTSLQEDASPGSPVQEEVERDESEVRPPPPMAPPPVPFQSSDFFDADAGDEGNEDDDNVVGPPSEDEDMPALMPFRARNRFLNLSIPDELRENLDAAATGMAPRYSESTARKMELSSKVWKQVARQRNWDLTVRIIPDDWLLEFVYLCLHRDYGICYGLFSFRDNYLPMLFRWFDRERILYSEEIQERLKHKIRSMVKAKELSHEQIPKQRGAEPICSFDLNHIAHHYPKGARDRTQVMAWMAIGLHTGARGVSLESALWEDLKIAQPSPEEAPDIRQVTIVFRRTKGDDNWHHPVTMEGSVFNDSGSDPIYWLDQLVKHRLGPDTVLKQSMVARLNGPVLAAIDGSPVDKATMSARLETVGVYSGYPARLLSSHGLRAGFLCSVLLRQDTGNEVSIQDGWTKAALIAGWTVNSKHMVGYVKNALLRCLVSSRLIQDTAGADEEAVANIIGVGAVAKTRLNPVDFHGLDAPLVPSWPAMCRYQLFQDALSESISLTIRQHRPDLAMRRAAAESSIRNKLYVQLAVTNRLCDTTSDGEDANDGEFLAELPSSSTAKRLVHRWIGDRFDEEPSPFWLDRFVGRFISGAVTTLALAYTPVVAAGPVAEASRKRSIEPKTSSEASPVAAASTSMKRAKTKNGSRKRAAWTVDETRALCRGILNHGSGKWAVIAALPGLERRSNVQCKDRSRNVKQQQGAETIAAAAESWLEENAE